MSVDYAMREEMLADATIAALVVADGKKRIYPEELPQDPILPAITITELSGPRDYSNDGDTGWVDGLFQVVCFGSTHKDTKALADAVVKLLSGFSGMMGPTKQVAVDAVFVEDRRQNVDTEIETPEKDGSRIRRVDLDLRIQYHEDL